MIAVVCDDDLIAPGSTTVAGSGHDFGEFLTFAQHDLRANGKASIWQIHHVVGFKSHDIGFVWAVPDFAFVCAPPDPIARRLVFMKVAEIVVVTDDSDSIVAEQTDARCDQTFVSFTAVGGCYFIQFVPASTIIVTIQDCEDLCCFSPVGFGVGVDEEETSGCETDDIGIFCKSGYSSVNTVF